VRSTRTTTTKPMFLYFNPNTTANVHNKKRVSCVNWWNLADSRNCLIRIVPGLLKSGLGYAFRQQHNHGNIALISIGPSCADITSSNRRRDRIGRGGKANFWIPRILPESPRGPSVLPKRDTTAKGSPQERLNSSPFTRNFSLVESLAFLRGASGSLIGINYRAVVGGLADYRGLSDPTDPPSCPSPTRLLRASKQLLPKRNR